MLLAMMPAATTNLPRDAGDRIVVRLHGDAPEDAKERILRDADVFVPPARHAGFCVPIVEALAAGCKVIAYDNSNTPAVTGGLASLVSLVNVD
ncbi:glycosyltransferase [Massilia sp. GER05]|uniref:glycosyltransferase n=1 Tax=Massilia sp. GER05 TaxID=3394605 RepID=UPI003F833204